MSPTQAYICEYCLANINKADVVISASEYIINSDINCCSFCFYKCSNQYALFNSSYVNIERIKNIIIMSDIEYDTWNND